MNLLTYRSFSTELLKIANDLGDADIRALLAERRGEEYLKGGELATSEATPAERLVPAGTSQVKIANPMPAVEPPKPGPTTYQKVRDAAAFTAGGAATGAGAAKLLTEMSGRGSSPKALRIGAGIGTGVALADRAIRHRHDIKNALQPKVKVAAGGESHSVTREKILGLPIGKKTLNYGLYDNDPGVVDAAHDRYQEMGLPPGSVTKSTTADLGVDRPGYHMSLSVPHREAMKHPELQKMLQKTALVQQNTAASFNSPADALASAQTVGKFQNRVHQSAAKVPGQLGKMPKPHVL